VVADANGATLASDLALDRLMALQRDLDEHGDVGGVISLALLMAEAERPWYSFLLSWDFRFDRMESDSYDRIARRFVTPDRLQGRFILRMREHTRDRPRDEVVGEIEEIVRSHGFEPVLVGGLYPLQSEMSHLVDGGVVRGLGGLIACFSVIMLFVSRSVGTALAMVFCLALTPMILFGLVGLIGIPLDIISAPAANVALSLGIDEMIHLGYAVRRNRGERANAWRKALSQLWVPILYSALIVGCGFDPWIASRLQDFFGMGTGPSICRGRLALTVHLLAPNQRAVQVTKDLAGFWERHYPALRRELARRYPKHAWPEDGRTATPPAPRPRRSS
jgi:predicted RND superfamily exporter protein